MKRNRIHRTFEAFVGAGEQTAPARPTTKPGTKPGTRPGTRPERRMPVHKPAVDPKPKAENDVEVEDIINLFTLTASDKQKKQLEDYYASK